LEDIPVEQDEVWVILNGKGDWDTKAGTTERAKEALRRHWHAYHNLIEMSDPDHWKLKSGDCVILGGGNPWRDRHITV
jgi:mannose-6-phosphate isomerase-like protein (cupin superfamily)